MRRQMQQAMNEHAPPLSILTGRGVNKWKATCKYCWREEVVAARHEVIGQAKKKLIGQMETTEPPLVV